MDAEENDAQQQQQLNRSCNEALPELQWSNAGPLET